MMPRARLIYAVAAIAALALAFGATGCGPKYPTDDPAIEGVITSVSAGPETRTLLVEVPADELPGPESSYRGLDKVSATVTKDTHVYDEQGEPVAMSALQAGIRVRVWIAGPIAESYPPQGAASAVQVLRSAR